MPMKYIILAISVAFCSACTNSSRDPCKMDEFFCNGPKNSKNLSSVNDEELEKLSIINYKYYRPPSSTFAKEIGRRGESGKKILVDLTKKGVTQDYHLRSIIVYLKQYSHVDVCSDANLVIKSNSISKACAKITS